MSAQAPLETADKIRKAAEKYVSVIEAYFRCETNENLDWIGVERDQARSRLRIVRASNLTMLRERPGERWLVCGDVSQVSVLGKTHEERVESVMRALSSGLQEAAA